MDTNKKQLQIIGEDLNIKFNESDVQDWGIINSDSKRVNEFINYFNNNNLNDLMQYYVFELIVASYNDAILNGSDNSEIEEKFLYVIKSSAKNSLLDMTKNYWRHIYNEHEFPVGKLL